MRIEWHENEDQIFDKNAKCGMNMKEVKEKNLFESSSTQAALVQNHNMWI